MAADEVTKNSRRQNARDQARQRREAEARRKRRGRLFLQGGIGLAVVAIAIVVLVIVVNVGGSSSTPTNATGPANMATNGITFTGHDGEVTAVRTGAAESGATPAATNADGVPKVDTYIDWACPVCKQFEAAYSKKVLALVGSGKATLEVHPVAILDTHYGTTHYATRAANAAACVADHDPDDFLAVQQQFYAHQPDEGSSGLTDAQIRGLVHAGGATGSAIDTCLSSGRYDSWVAAETNAAVANPKLVNAASGGFGTPTVLINGKQWDEQSDLISDITSAR